MKKRRYLKKGLAILLIAAVVVGLMPGVGIMQVSAAAQEEEFRITENVTLSEEEAETDNDELFAGYVQKAFLGDSGISLFSTENHTMSLNTDEKSIYEALKSAVAKIADGSESSTEISIADWTKTFTYEELNLTGSSTTNEIRAAVQTAFANNISISKILCCLMADCPYEMYWYDKTAGTLCPYGISYNGSQCTLSSLCFKMQVASAYASTEDYKADTTITGATSTAVANAREIVTANEGKSDYEKLVAYRDKICELVSYNEDAANNTGTPYGDPWQLIYVFDGNSDTNVVCEGYSKAFQYLCELSDFTDDVICYTVSGYIPGGHMWNHVTIGGKNYLVDVTNCDAGAIGTPDKLFLKGMTGDISLGYTKTISNQPITYTFKDETKEMFGTEEDSILNLSADDYKEDAVQSVSASSSVSSLTWRYATGATLTATPTLATGVTATPTYQWYTVSGDNTETEISGATNATYTMESGLSAGTYTYRVYASIGDCKKSADVSVTVEPLVLTKDQLEFTSGTITKKYDGTTSSTATVQIKAGVVADGAVRIEGTAEYNSPNVSEADTVTFTPTAITTGNYRLAVTETISNNATIEKAPATNVVNTVVVNKKYLYSKDNEDSIDLSSYLPEDCGTVNYGEPQVDGVLYTGDKAPAISNNTLSYTVKEGTVGATGTIKVTVTTDNYTDYTITIKVELIDKIQVRLKADSSVSLVNSTLTYGEALSTLTFNSAVFVDGDGTAVPGTLDWADKTVKPTVAVTSAAWRFTPENSDYATVEGNLTIKVEKAEPNVKVLPTVADRTYHPATKLADTDLTGATVLDVNGNELSGTWKWKTADVIPTVENSGYDAVFTPADTDNYKTISKTITVKVKKATPYIEEAPTAAAITYGDTLAKATLTGGIVQYSSTDDTAVAGTFAWKVDTTKPAYADSNKTEYKVVFTPEDKNYNTVETDITVTVNKADAAPNKPNNTMEVDYGKEKVSDITTLPEGWAWQDADKDTALTVGTAVKATAVYTGADKGNYETESVEISITRAECTHATTEIRDAVAATCTVKGYIGDTYCKVCGEKVKTGQDIDALGHNFASEFTVDKEANCTEAGSKSKHCSRCEEKDEVTPIPKKEHTWDSGAVTKEATCTEKGVLTYTCDVCHETKTEDIAINKNNHAGEREVVGAVEATCKEAGYTGDTKCKACGVTLIPGTVIDKLTTHSYVNGVCSVCDDVFKATVDGVTYQVMTETGADGKPVGKLVTVSGNEVPQVAVAVTGTDDTLAENYPDGKVTVPSEITGSGSEQTFVVTKISENAFSRASVTEVVVPATVTEVETGAFGGATIITFKGTTAPSGIAEAITETVTTVNVPEGAADSYREALGESVDIVEAHTHTYADTWTYDATHHWHAATCGHAEEVADKAVHTFGSWVTVTEATEDTEGVKERSCSCGYKETAKIDKLAHTIHVKDEGIRVEPTCEKNGSITYKCTKCGEVMEVVELAALGHDFADTFTVDQKPTCTTAGSKSKHCSRCEEKTEVTEIVRTDHTWDAGKVTKEATETAEGEKTYTCTACGGTKTEAIPDTPQPPKQGDVVPDDKAAATVEVTDVKKKEVAYEEPANKKAKTVSIPATVTIDGVTYKVTKIADNAFKGNKTVTKVTVGSNIKTIGKNAFSGATKLQMVTIGKNVTKIEANAFKGCKKLKTIKITSTKLSSKTVSKNAFKGLTKATTIKVPKKKLAAYKKLLKSKGLSSKVKVVGY